MRLSFIVAACIVAASTAQAAASKERHPGDNGPATRAEVNDPTAIAVDGSETLYIVERFSTIRRVDLRTGIITTVPIKTPLEGVTSLAVDANGTLIAGESFLHRVSRIDPRTGSVTVIAGGKRGFSGDGGPAADAELNSPSFVAINPADNIYIADSFNNRIRRVAGDGTIATVAKVSLPQELALDKEGNILVSGYGRSSKFEDLQRIGVKSGLVESVSLAAGFESPSCLIFDRTGKLYALGRNEDRVQEIDYGKLIIWTSAATAAIHNGTSSNIQAPLCGGRVAFDFDGNLYVGDFTGHRVRRINVRTGVIQIIAGNGLPHHVHVVQ